MQTLHRFSSITSGGAYLEHRDSDVLAVLKVATDLSGQLVVVLSLRGKRKVLARAAVLEHKRDLRTYAPPVSCGHVETT